MEDLVFFDGFDLGFIGEVGFVDDGVFGVEGVFEQSYDYSLM